MSRGNRTHLKGGSFSVCDDGDTDSESTTESVFGFDDSESDDVDGAGCQQVKKSPSSKRPSSSPQSQLPELPEPALGYDLIRGNIKTQLEFGIGLKLDQDVKPYKDLPAKKVMPYRVRRAVSPFEFYLEHTIWSEHLTYSNWFKEMQRFYEDPVNQDNCILVEGVPLPGRCYVCQDYKDNKWHRVRLHQINQSRTSPTSLVVFYLDLCKLQETTMKHLLELDAKFAVYPACVFRCYLHDITPACQKGLEFSPEACDYFKRIMKDKEFSGVVLTRSCSVIVQGLPDFFTDFGIVLVENMPGSTNTRTDVCSVNAMMVDAGFAIAVGVGASCRHTAQIDDYEVLSEDWSSLLQSMKIEDTKMTSPLKGVCDPFTVGGLPYLDVYLNISSNKNATNRLPAKIAKQLAYIRICHVVSPSLMVVHLKSKEPELETMQEAIKQQVESAEGLIDGCRAMLVACNILDGGGGQKGMRKERNIWCRGVIKGAFESTYKVVLVDYGNEVTVQGEHVRELPDLFKQIPSFAIRIHLDVKNLVPAGKCGWSIEACTEFRHYAFIWEQDEPIYFFYRPSHARCFEIEDFAQQIVYDYMEDQWMPSAQYKRHVQHEALNALKSHPMVRSLFVSFGVEVMYEIIVPTTAYWHFDSISDVLTTKKHAIFDKNRKIHNPTRLHVDIISASQSEQIDRHPSLPVPIVASKNTFKSKRMQHDDNKSSETSTSPSSRWSKTKKRVRSDKRAGPSP